MRSKPPFDSKKIIEDAASGKLSLAEIRKAIKRADDLGLKDVQTELKLYLVSPSSFADDGIPKEISDRVAQGISVLVGMGHNPQRTRNMLKKNGVIETINRIAKNRKASSNFERLVASDHIALTAESIVVDFPDYFSEEALAIASSRLDEICK